MINRKRLNVWLICAAICGLLFPLESCDNSITVDYRIDDSKIVAEIPDSLIVVVGHELELYIPVPTYDGHPVNEADIRIVATSRMKDIASATTVNDSTFIIRGESIGEAIVDFVYGTWSKSVNVSVVDEMISALHLGVSDVELNVGDTLDVAYTVDPEHLIGHRMEIDIPGLESVTNIYYAYTPGPGLIKLRAFNPGETVLTFTVDTCRAVIRCRANEVPPQDIEGHYVEGTWNISAGESDSSQFNVLPYNTTYPELDLVLTEWEPQDLIDVPVTDAEGRTVGTVKSNYVAERDSVGDPVLTVDGVPVPYRDSTGNVIGYSNAQISSRCVYEPRIEDYLLYDGHRLNNHKMTGLKACTARFRTFVKRYPAVSCTFEVKVSGGTHTYTDTIIIK